MPDLLDQLHDYGDALESRVQIVTAAEVTDVDRRPAERAQRRSRRLWIVAASAAAIAVLVAGTFAVVQRGNQPFAGTGPVPPAQLRATLVGHDYRSTSVTEDGAPRPVLGMALDADPRLFLSFHEDRLDWGGGCNGSSGGWDVVDASLVLDLERAVSTAAQCQPELMEQDRWLSDFLMSSPTIALDGDRLTLANPTIVIELLDQDAPAPVPTETSTTTAPVPGTIEALEGRRFLSVSVTDGGVPRELAPSIDQGAAGGPSYLFIEVRDGRLSASGECNARRWDSTAIVDGRLSLAEAGQSLRDCGAALDDQDAWFFTFLEAGPTITLAGDTLTLADGTTEIVLVDSSSAPTAVTTTSAPDPTVADEALVGHNWLLDHVEEGTVSWSISPDIALNSEGPPSVMFVAEAPAGGTALVSGHDGCTGFIGAYGLDGSTITFGPFLDNTIGGCPSEDGDKVAAAIEAVLDSDPTWAIRGDELRLSNDVRTLVVRSADG